MATRYKIVTIVAIVLVILALSVFIFTVNVPNEDTNILANPVKFQPVGVVPEEGVTLSARYYPSPGKVENQGVVLLHMLGSDQKSWEATAAKLQAENYEVLTLDFRGHGESVGSWEDFTEEDFAKFAGDVEEALRYLYDTNNEMRIIIMGSSIGANVGLQVAADDPRVAAVIALSPSHNYKEISSTQANASLTIPTLYVVSEQDQQSFAATQELANTLPNEKRTLQVFSGKAHGNELLEKHPELFNDIITWLHTNL